VPKQITARLDSGARRSAKSAGLRAPNPGDILMTVVFSWALLCFFLVTIGERLLIRLATLAKSDAYKELVLNSGEALGVIMVGGSIIVVATVLLCHKFPRVFLASLLFSFSFAAAQNKLLHDIAFVMKYLSLVYLGAYAGLSLLINFWRIVETPYIRIALLFTAWIAGVSQFLGGQIEDTWYIVTVFSLLIGFGVFFVYEFNNRFGMEDFFKVLSWGAIAVVLVNWTAPVFFADYIQEGRFQGYTTRATGFSVPLVPIVLLLMWRAMADKDPQVRSIYLLLSLAGFALILWSGSRSPAAATLLGTGLLWLRFRSAVFLGGMIIAVLGIAAQLIFNIGEVVETETISTRLSNIDTGRFELWLEYIEVAAKSPIYGYSPSQLGFVLSGEFAGLFQAFGATEVDYEAVHNAYLAIAMRFGVVGLVLFLILLIAAVRKAKQVLDMPEIPADKKDVIILPLVLVLAISFMQIFEDQLPGTGKGTPVDILLYASMVICHVYGNSLINHYKYKNTPQSATRTLEGFNVAMPPENVP